MARGRHRLAVALLLVGCGAGDSTGLDGDLRVSTSTSGQDTYAGGYTVTLDGTQTEAVGLLDTVLFVHVGPGEHTVQIGGVGPPCSLTGTAIRTVPVKSEQTAELAFAVDCPAEIRRDIVFTSLRDGNAEIYRMSSLGAGAIRLTDNLAFDGSPRWSPDGSKIAFNSNRDGDYDIYVMDADGSNARRVVDNPFSATEPDWSPSGSSLIYLTDANIYAVNLDGSGRVNLTNENEQIPRSFGGPRWSPDGSKIALTLGSGIFTGIYPRVVLFDPATGVETPLLDEPSGGVRSPAWSPDGTRIALSQLDDIWLINPDGSGATQVTDDAAFDNAPSWSPDGSFLAFAGVVVGDNVIYRIRPDGTERLLLADKGSFQPDWR